ncbi:MAG: 4Fe-4S cluster-binding domain-containing protein [Anaerolineae bacterium]|nr:4Fe-4S cluster-binding domain-containing protein [Anaerolineae bacterium]
MAKAAYLALLGNGALKQRVEAAYQHLKACDICPRECGVDRLAGETGICHTAEQAIVASAGPHFGEERPLVGRNGSGTIFFSWCNLNCQYCQNDDISQGGQGEPLAPQTLAAIMLDLQRRGCHNINLVSPSHVVPQILAATLVAAKAGLHLPLVYNTGGYDSLKTLALLDGVVDIYMPDVKYADEAIAAQYSKVRNYPAINQAAVREMYHQVGDLIVDERGIATCGLLVRHLVLPNELAGTADMVRFLASLSTNTYLNVMDQYRPCYQARSLPLLNRRITSREYQDALRLARKAGLCRLDDRVRSLLF